MDTTQIKAYAPQARKDFINAVTQRAARFGIHGDGNFDPVEFKGDTAIIGSQVFTKKGGELRERLAAKVKQTGFEMFNRSSAYTWFNRFVAIRYMELHDFLDHGFRVLSNPNGSDIPEVLEHATEVNLPGLDREKVLELRLAGDKDNELYRMLVIAQCNALHKAMPFLFDRIDSEAELLLPDNLLHTNSPVKRMVSQIDETLWDDVEIIGWIYQFYISEKKDEVIGKVVKSEDIPAATQLFTPNWIVKYMVQNTLGRMWMATYPESSLKSKMEYYIEPAEQEPDVQAEIDATTPKELNPEELTFLDPACGSGHILVEAYDILKEIYLERGYRTRDIPRLILSKNIYGLDIDDRAAQLACFAVLMRAREDDRRLFGRDDLALNVMSIVETKGIDKDKLLDAVSKKDGGEDVWMWIKGLVELFEDAKTFGALITVPDELSGKLDNIDSIIEKDQIGNNDIFNYIAGTELHNLKPFVKQAQVSSKKYDCVVTNPPYIGGKGMNKVLKSYAKTNFPDSKSDVFAMFTEKIIYMVKESGHIGLVMPYVWMFLGSYEAFRNKIISNTIINSLIQLEYNAFEPACVPVASFTLSKQIITHYKGDFIKLSDFKGHQNQAPKTLEAIHNPSCGWRYRASTRNFKIIPGCPIAYWASKQIRSAFTEGKIFSEIAEPKKGITTADNEKYLRMWHEIDKNDFETFAIAKNGIVDSKKKWFPVNKGGTYRKWYGNKEVVINWFDNGEELKNFVKSVIRNPSYYFKEGMTWNDISSGKFAMRYSFGDAMFEGKGPMAFAKNSEELNSFLSFFNSKVAAAILSFLCPTLNFNIGEISKVPIIDNVLFSSKTAAIAVSCITISKSDWDFYETSWDFSCLSLLNSSHRQQTIEKSCHQLWKYWGEMVLEMQQLEEENNRILIDAYGLNEEITPEIPLSEITLTCNPLYRYGDNKEEIEYKKMQQTDTVKELISYVVGCMMGRFSIDHPSVVYAHYGNIDFNPFIYNSFPVDDDGIIPIMDMDWFKDDSTKRFIEFIKTAWPKEYLDENLKFVSDSLNPKTNESPEDIIRRYLSTTFFKDHMKMYKKRPIYWLFSSGKQKAFECLVYLHRYNESTLSRMRSNYVTPLQGNISARIEFLDHEKNAATTPSAQKKIQKQIDVLKKKQVELKSFDDELRHYADMKISLDLDDGVKVNYGKFGNLLAEKKAITGDSDV